MHKMPEPIESNARKPLEKNLGTFLRKISLDKKKLKDKCNFLFFIKLNFLFNKGLKKLFKKYSNDDRLQAGEIKLDACS